MCPAACIQPLLAQVCPAAYIQPPFQLKCVLQPTFDLYLASPVAHEPTRLLRLRVGRNELDVAAFPLACGRLDLLR